MDRVADRYSASIMDRHRKALRTWFEGLSKGGKIPTKADLEKPFSPEINAEQVKDVERVLSLSFLLGLDHGSSDLELADGDVIDEPLPFEEAEKFFKSRVSLTKKEWLDLEPKLRFRAFTIAALGDPDIIDKVRTRMIAQLKTGGTLESFWNLEKVEAMAGVSKKSPFYWETVYRTNMQTSYNAGRAMEYQKTQPEYLEFVGIEDERQTSVCAQRSGIILPSTHPFWSTNWPPLHFNCRSTVRGVFKEEIDVIKETNPSWETTPDRNLPREQIQGGFGGNPLDSEAYWKPTPKMISRAQKYGMDKEFRAFGKSILGEQDFARAYTSKNSGGLVDLAEEHGKNETAKNLIVAEKLAAKGYKIKLLPVKNSEGIKNPDALMMDGYRWDIKVLESTGDTAIKNTFSSAKGQASRIVLQTPSELKNDEYRAFIKRLSHRMNRHQWVEEVIIVNGDDVEVIRRSGGDKK